MLIKSLISKLNKLSEEFVVCGLFATNLQEAFDSFEMNKIEILLRELETKLKTHHET